MLWLFDFENFAQFLKFRDLSRKIPIKISIKKSCYSRKKITIVLLKSMVSIHIFELKPSSYLSKMKIH